MTSLEDVAPQKQMLGVVKLCTEVSHNEFKKFNKIIVDHWSVALGEANPHNVTGSAYKGSDY